MWLTGWPLRQINSADGLVHGTITLDGAPSVDLNGGDFVFL